MPNVNYGDCLICGLRFKLIASGLLTRHGGKKKGAECPGSSQLPLTQPSSAPVIILTDPAFKFSNNILSSETISNQNRINSLADLCKYLNSSKKPQIVRHIPKASRVAFRNKISLLMLDICNNPDNAIFWGKLLAFPFSTLFVDKAQMKNNSSSIIKKRIKEYNGLSSVPILKCLNTDFKSISDNNLAKGVKSKIEQGNIRAAVRLLAAEETLAPINTTTINALKDKHPLGNYPLLGLPNLTEKPFEINISKVVQAIRSFPAGSAGGLDGLRPQHFKDLLDGGPGCDDFTEALTQFINLFYKGMILKDVKTIIFGGNITALIKKDGGIRPITVGSVFRRLAAKCANSHALGKLKAIASTRQLGVGVKGGAEAAVHAARLYLRNIKEKAFVKLDFKNAFNCLDRTRMLSTVHRIIPELYNFCYDVYAAPINLNFGGVDIFSSSGVQQGDPLGPLLFAITIQPIIDNIKSEFVLAYLDDISFGDEADVVECDYLRIKTAALEFGLELNISKCEFISALPAVHPLNFNNFIFRRPEETELLGAAITKGSALDKILGNKEASLERITSRLSLISAHDALLILRYSLSVPRIVYILRCSPCLGHPLLFNFDKLIRKCLTEISNVSISDNSWDLASLPIKSGGLGLRSAATLSAFAFLASVNSTRELTFSLLPASTHSMIDFDLRENTIEWSKLYGPLPPPSLAGFQKVYDAPFIEQSFAKILSDANTSQDRARLLAIKCPYASSWLNAWPLSSCGVRLSDSEIRVAIALRLGSNLCLEHKCKCGATVFPNGLHGLSCHQSAGRHCRHSMLNEIISKALTSIDIPCVREPIGLNNANGLRPDGITLIPWKQGKCLAWDVTVPDTLAFSHLPFTSILAGSAAKKAADSKISKYASLSDDYNIMPIAVETFGVFDNSSLLFLKNIGAKLNAKFNDNKQSIYLFQKISCAIIKGNCVSILGNFNLVSEVGAQD